MNQLFCTVWSKYVKNTVLQSSHDGINLIPELVSLTTGSKNWWCQ